MGESKHDGNTFRPVGYSNHHLRVLLCVWPDLLRQIPYGGADHRRKQTIPQDVSAGGRQPGAATAPAKSMGYDVMRR